MDSGLSSEVAQLYVDDSVESREAESLMQRSCLDYSVIPLTAKELAISDNRPIPCLIIGGARWHLREIRDYVSSLGTIR